MNEISLIYYGDLAQIQQHLLYLLNILKVRSATQDRSGFYAIESRHGYESAKRLTLDPGNTEAEAVLIYRYLSDEELSQIQTGRSNVKYYVLPHKLFDLEYIGRVLEKILMQTWIITDYSNSSKVQNYSVVKKAFNTKNMLRINTPSAQAGANAKTEKAIPLPVLVLFLMKILINPINEINRYYVLIKYSNLRLLSRFIELLLFLDFIVKAVVFKTLVHTYYQFKFLSGVLKVLLIKFGFFIRHILLMMGFRSFGFFIDSYYLIVRSFNRLIYYFYYRFTFFIYYKVLYSLYFDIVKPVLHTIYYRLGYFLFYRLKHFCLMTAFKTYGILFDCSMFLFRFTKLIIMYPVFKIIWFSTFQYEKRVKKYFSHDT